MPRRFLLKVGFFAAGAAGLAFLLQWALVWGLEHYDTSSRGIWNRVLRGEVNADIIVCGSSRAMVHYDPQVVSSTTGRSAFNLGRNGTHLDLQLSFLKAYLAHNKSPLCIVQNIDIFCFQTTVRVYDPGQYIPYLNEPDLYRDLVAIDPSYARMRKIPLVGIIEHRLFLTALGGLLGITVKEEYLSGYKPKDLKWTGDFEKYRVRNPDGIKLVVEPPAIQKLRELIEVCLQSKARLILVYSPEYQEGQVLFNNRAEVMAKVRELAGSYSVEFWDFSDDPICQDKSLFYNSQHLNRRGATLFSQKLAQRLKHFLAAAPPG